MSKAVFLVFTNGTEQADKHNPKITTNKYFFMSGLIISNSRGLDKLPSSF
jgi:hypothetical protein